MTLTRKQLKAIHARKVRATNKARTLATKTFKNTFGGTTTIQAKTPRGAGLLRKAKTLKEFDEFTRVVG